MKTLRKLTALGLSLLLVGGAASLPAAAAGETASKGSTMLGGDFKSLDGTWAYENGVFTVTGGTFTADKKVGLQFTRESSLRDFVIEYEVNIPSSCVDSDEVCLSLRTPKDSYLREGLIVVADKYGLFYNDMINWNNKCFGASINNGSWEYDSWHKVKITAKGARINLQVDKLDAINAVINKVTPGLDAQYDNGYINLVIGSSEGTNALSKGYAKIKNLKITAGSKVYAYTENGISRPGDTAPTDKTTKPSITNVPGKTDPTQKPGTPTQKPGAPTEKPGTPTQATASGENPASDQTPSDTGSVPEASDTQQSPAPESGDSSKTAAPDVDSRANLADSSASEAEGGSAGLIAAIIAIVVVILGAGTAAILLIVKKK